MSERYEMTSGGLEALQDQINDLETRGRAEIAAQIKTARDFGDLKENAEYHDAKEAQAHLETKILRLRALRDNSVIVETGGSGDEVALGVAVTVRDVESGRERIHTIVSAAESDPASGKLSIDSPLGRALTGARVGDEVTFDAPRGQRTLEIVALEP